MRTFAWVLRLYRVKDIVTRYPRRLQHDHTDTQTDRGATGNMLDATVRAHLERLAEGEDEATRFTAREVLLDAEEANLQELRTKYADVATEVPYALLITAAERRVQTARSRLAGAASPSTSSVVSSERTVQLPPLASNTRS